MKPRHIRKRLIALAFFCSLSACDRANEDISPSAKSKKISVVDFSGRTVSLEAPAKRIIALAPHVVENVFSAGAGDSLVGVVAHSNYPAKALSLPIVGGYAKMNLEKILELQPDLVIAWESGNSNNSVARIQELGFTVYLDQADKLHDIAKSIRDIGILAGTQETAHSVADTYLAKLASMQSQGRHKQPVSTFYQVWHSPLRTINGKHIISDAIALCGGTNLYADQITVAPIINIESILERDPEVIIASGISDALDERENEWKNDWKKWPSLTAVKRDNLYFVDPDHIQRHTTRIILGLEKICQQMELARQKRNTTAMHK